MGTNTFFITLVPEVDNPQSLDRYRLISLIGCLYKIVFQILARRLKAILHKVIDVKQLSSSGKRGH